MSKTDRRVYLPSGAICGLDGVKSASLGEIYGVELQTRKPPKSLMGVKYLADMGVDLLKVREPTVVYEGSAVDAVKRFPKNVNVCAALSLAGVGPEKTRVRIVVDPGIDRNIHEVTVHGEFGELYTKTSNLPSQDNPKTSYLACLSAVKTLEGINRCMRVGT